VACASGAIQILEVQRPGRRPMSADEFLRGFPLRLGAQL
jgi:methionyl-tRNA formyltransferase